MLDEASAAGTLDAKLAELQNAVDEKFPLAAPKFSSLEWLAKSLKSTKEGYAERRAVMILVKETKKKSGRQNTQQRQMKRRIRGNAGSPPLSPPPRLRNSYLLKK